VIRTKTIRNNRCPLNDGEESVTNAGHKFCIAPDGHWRGVHGLDHVDDFQILVKHFGSSGMIIRWD